MVALRGFLMKAHRLLHLVLLSVLRMLSHGLTASALSVFEKLS